MRIKSVRPKPVTKSKLKSGESYFLFSFNGKSHNISYGKLSALKPQSNYVFRGEDDYKYFDAVDIKKAKTGQPLRAEIRNGRLTFMVMFISEKEATSSIESLPRIVAVHLVKDSIDKDKKKIAELSESIMTRISMMNDIITSKNISEVSVAVKNSAGEKKNHFSFRDDVISY